MIVASKFTEQIRAVKLAVEMGRRLQTAVPEIADLYRVKSSYREVAEHLFAEGSRVGGITSVVVLEHSVRCAICGNTEPGLGEVYPGLLEREEQQKVALRHKKENGVRRGKATLAQKTGICAMTREELRNAAQMAALARGQRVWGDEERAYALMRKADPKYVDQRGCHNLGKIVSEINAIFHGGKPVRNANSLNKFYSREEDK